MTEQQRFRNKEMRAAYLADPNKPETFSQYKSRVDTLTEKIAYLVPGIERRGFRQWDLDHKIPISYGFKNNIHPYKMACLSNLQMLPHLDNFKKKEQLLFPLSILDQHDTIQSQLQDG